MRRWLRVLALLMAAALVVTAPHLLWRAERARTLDVVVVDKTVPFRNYREHAVVPWLLHAMKIRAPTGRFLDPAVDYVGFDPQTKIGALVTEARLAHAEVVVVTDTYGVYIGDYERPGDQAALERSPKIYGGLDLAEVAALESFVARGGRLIAEFNTFASPTEVPARERLETLFGARWTRWVARYWPDLQDANEVPRWVGRVWEKITHTPFDMTGGGLVFVREDEDIVVLLQGEDLRPEVVTQERTSQRAPFDMPARGGFWFWMDVVDATDAEVFHEHVIAATASGKEKLGKHGLAGRFPAVMRRGEAWYFAGDFADTAVALGNPERAGLLGWRRQTTGCGGGTSADESFFWGFYAPILSRLLDGRAR